ncbi:MAG: hypothetical protein ABIP94_05360 [Planctomycetota bacterium]
MQNLPRRIRERRRRLGSMVAGIRLLECQDVPTAALAWLRPLQPLHFLIGDTMSKEHDLGDDLAKSTSSGPRHRLGQKQVGGTSDSPSPPHTLVRPTVPDRDPRKPRSPGEQRTERPGGNVSTDSNGKTYEGNTGVSGETAEDDRAFGMGI